MNVVFFPKKSENKWTTKPLPSICRSIFVINKPTDLHREGRFWQKEILSPLITEKNGKYASEKEKKRLKTKKADDNSSDIKCTACLRRLCRFALEKHFSTYWCLKHFYFFTPQQGTIILTHWITTCLQEVFQTKEVLQRSNWGKQHQGQQGSRPQGLPERVLPQSLEAWDLP